MSEDDTADDLDDKAFVRSRAIVIDLMARLFPEGSMKFAHDTLPKKLIDDAVEEIARLWA